MSAYLPPGDIQVNVSTNPRIINSGDETRLVALVGLGQTTISVVDEAIQRATGSVDNLSVYSVGVTGVSVSKITNTPGVGTGLNNVFVSLNGALYNPASASVGGSGTLSWPQGVIPNANVDIPASGSVYYVSYSYNVPATQFNPAVFNDKTVILNQFGAENNTNGLLSIGGSIVLENGGPAVLLCQVSGSVYNEANYKLAIDKLQKKSNIEQLIILFPSGSVTRAQQESLLTYAYTHVQLMSANKRERGLLSGSPSTYFASDGFDVIGDASTSGTYGYRANILRNKNVGYVVPSRGRRKDANGNYMELDANYAAVAVAGAQSAQPLRSTPIGGYQIVGIEIENEKWNEFEMNQLGGYNCIVLESRDNVVTVRDFITTDPTSADTAEQSVVAQERLVKRSLRNGLDNVYKGKGVVITPEIPIDVQGTVRSILSSLVSQRELYAFGETDNPLTGEQKINAAIDATEPRRINITCSVRYLYPLKWMTVNVSTYV